MYKKGTILILFTLFYFSAFAQNIKSTQNIILSKDTSLLIRFIKLFKGSPNPLIDSSRINLNKSIQYISNQEGKRIHKIHFEHQHFGNFRNGDTTFQQNALTNLANKLHNATTDNTIRKNLFFHENEYLNPLVIAYNEKWLRDIDYMQDARIVALPLLNDSNLVDLFVITKDIFPFGANLVMDNLDAYDASFTIENIKDKGNGITLYQNFNINRENKVGIGGSYLARNILGSFIDVSISAHNLAKNYANAQQSASTFTIKGDLPLRTPLSKWTGGFEWNNSNNSNAFPTLWTDSFYLSAIQYKYSHTDAWVGHQLFNKPWNFNNDHYHHFIQFRFLKNIFFRRPENYLAQIDKNYQNLTAYLFSYTIFKQKIIRTQYLYGFGRNEDLPSGKSITLTTGHYKRENSTLPYLGFQLESYQLQPNEVFTHLFFNAGTSYANKELVDFKLLASIELISKLHYLANGNKYRSIFNVSFAETLKNKFNDVLLINSIYGIPQLTKERIKGGSRLSTNLESIWYNATSFYGFNLSPFAFANLTYIRTIGDPIERGDIYSAIGGGSRIRNENLIFGTIEIKGYYFPRTQLQISPWNLTIGTNLQFKYKSNLVNKPDFVQVN